MRIQELDLHRRRRSSSSSSSLNRRILPSNHLRSSSASLVLDPYYGEEISKKSLVVLKHQTINSNSLVSSKTRSIVAMFGSIISSIPTLLCQTPPWLQNLRSIPSRLLISSGIRRKVTVTLFGHKKGHVNLVIQEDPRSEPVLLLELAMSTSTLVKEMSTGLVRIALECERRSSSSSSGSGRTGCVKRLLFQEPVWTIYCNGKRYGYANSRMCSDYCWHVLSRALQSVSVGAGVIPLESADEELRDHHDQVQVQVMYNYYMRARFERVVGSRDSEALYMINPDGIGNGVGPELSIFLLRI